MDFSSNFEIPSGITYFDSAASSLTCNMALEKMSEYYRTYRSNIHRGEHRLTKKASQEYESVYSTLAKFFGAKESEFIQVRNCTEAINGAALGLGLKEGDEIITTDIEHHSNFLPWLRLKEKGVKIKILKAGEQGQISPESLSSILSKNTKLFAFSTCSNVLGQKVPIEELVKIAKDNGTLTLLDAAQFVGHHPLNLSKIPADYMAFSSHKCFGPTGAGVLYHREGAPLTPWYCGGGTIADVTLEDFKFIKNRERFEAGTPSIAEWIGFGEAIKFISKIGYEKIESHENSLISKMLEGFSSTKNISLYGPGKADEKSCALFSFNIKGVPHHQVAIMLDKLGFATRSGHHCAIPLTKKLSITGSVRASLHIYNNEAQIEKFFGALKKVSMLGG